MTKKCSGVTVTFWTLRGDKNETGKKCCKIKKIKKDKKDKERQLLKRHGGEEVPKI